MIFKSSDFTFPAGVGKSAPAPQNIDLTTSLDTFVCPGTIHFSGLQEKEGAENFELALNQLTNALLKLIEKK